MQVFIDVLIIFISCLTLAYIVLIHITMETTKQQKGEIKMKLCEICEQGKIETAATTTRFIEHVFGNTDSRNVALCEECAEQCDAYEIAVEDERS